MHRIFPKMLVVYFLWAIFVLVSVFSLAYDGYIESRGFHFYGAGARPFGMGGAFIAVGGDPTSAFWNPAGLATLREAQISFSYNLTGTNKTTREAWGNEEFQVSAYESSLDISGIDYVSISLPFRQNNVFMVHQISYHHIHDFGYNGSLSEPYVFTQPGLTRQFEQNIDSTGSLQAISYTIAFEFFDFLHFGMAYNHYMGGYNYTNEVQNLYTFGPSEAIETLISVGEWDFLGDNFSLGIIITPAKFIRIGGTYKTKYDLKAEYERTDTYVFSESSTVIEETMQSNGEATIKHPSMFAFGVAVFPIEGLTIAADYSYKDWAQSKNADGKYTNGVIQNFYFPFDPTNPPVTSQDWTYPTFINAQSTSQQEETFIRIGGEYGFKLNKDISAAVRAGFWQQQALFTDSTGETVNFTGFTTGIGIYLDILRLDIAYVQSSGDYPNPDGEGVEEWSDSRVFAQISYVFEAF